MANEETKNILAHTDNDKLLHTSSSMQVWNMILSMEEVANYSIIGIYCNNNLSQLQYRESIFVDSVELDPSKFLFLYNHGSQEAYSPCFKSEFCGDLLVILNQLIEIDMERNFALKLNASCYADRSSWPRSNLGTYPEFSRINLDLKEN